MFVRNAGKTDDGYRGDFLVEFNVKIMKQNVRQPTVRLAGVSKLIETNIFVPGSRGASMRSGYENTHADRPDAELSGIRRKVAVPEGGVPSAARRPAFLRAISRLRTSLPALTEEDERSLQDAALPETSYKANAELVSEGDASDRLHLLTEGWAYRYMLDRDGSRQIVALALPGDFANLDMLMHPKPDFDVRTLTPVKVISVSAEQALSLARQHPGIGLMFARLALIENRILSQWALGLGRKAAPQRLAHLFCELEVRTGGDGSDGSVIKIPLLQEQLADIIGITSVHVNRTLRYLHDEGLIERDHRSITFPDMDRIHAFCDFNPAYLQIDSPKLPARCSMAGGADHGSPSNDAR